MRKNFGSCLVFASRILIHFFSLEIRLWSFIDPGTLKSKSERKKKKYIYTAPVFQILYRVFNYKVSKVCICKEVLSPHAFKQNTLRSSTYSTHTCYIERHHTSFEYYSITERYYNQQLTQNKESILPSKSSRETRLPMNPKMQRKTSRFRQTQKRHKNH